MAFKILKLSFKCHKWCLIFIKCTLGWETLDHLLKNVFVLLQQVKSVDEQF